eukprot:scaffold8033_cov267-Pinguiococcus_pyrenoidosus.AAC.1
MTNASILSIQSSFRPSCVPSVLLKLRALGPKRRHGPHVLLDMVAPASQACQPVLLGVAAPSSSTLSVTTPLRRPGRREVGVSSAGERGFPHAVGPAAQHEPAGHGGAVPQRQEWKEGVAGRRRLPPAGQEDPSDAPGAA